MLRYLRKIVGMSLIPGIIIAIGAYLIEQKFGKVDLKSCIICFGVALSAVACIFSGIFPYELEPYYPNGENA